MWTYCTNTPVEEHDIAGYLQEVRSIYNIYYAKDVPTSKIAKVSPLLNFPQNFNFAIELTKIIGIQKSKDLVKLMIDTAQNLHMGYDKPEFEAKVKYQELDQNHKLLYDWVKTYAFIKRYTEFFLGRDKYIHPVLFFDNKEKKAFPTIHPGTARVRCVEYLLLTQKRDILLDLVYYSKKKESKDLFEKSLDIKLISIENLNDYFDAYGYTSLEHYKRDHKHFKYDTELKYGYPEYYHFLKKEQYIPYLYEAYYNIFKYTDTKTWLEFPI